MATEKTDTRLLDIKQVSARLCMSVRAIHRMRDTGKMPQPLKLGRSARWRSSDIEAWIQDGCRDVGRG